MSIRYPRHGRAPRSGVHLEASSDAVYLVVPMEETHSPGAAQSAAAGVLRVERAASRKEGAHLGCGLLAGWKARPENVNAALSKRALADACRSV